VGQHYLSDGHVLKRIADLAAIGPGEMILEVGPGPGALTRRLATTGAPIVGIEVDERFSSNLMDLHREFPQLRVAWGDVLKLDWEPLWGDTPPERRVIVGNIPYQITSPLMARLALERTRFSRALIMMQREVAERLVAPPGTRERSALTVKMALDFRSELILRVKPQAFKPQPRVASAVVRLTPLTDPPVANEQERTMLRQLIEAAFGSRRQQLINSLTRHWRPSLSKAVWADLLERAGIAPTLRAESLEREQFSELVKFLANIEKRA
jgi:16S rRNA (adenine1518-N6/adenine1519-N6)-dimethyltransferase